MTIEGPGLEGANQENGSNNEIGDSDYDNLLESITPSIDNTQTRIEEIIANIELRDEVLREKMDIADEGTDVLQMLTGIIIRMSEEGRDMTDEEKEIFVTYYNTYVAQGGQMLDPNADFSIGELNIYFEEIEVYVDNLWDDILASEAMDAEETTYLEALVFELQELVNLLSNLLAIYLKAHTVIAQNTK